MSPTPVPPPPPPPRQRVLAEAITIYDQTYPQGTITDAIPAAVIRWLVEGSEYEWVPDAPAPKGVPDARSR